MTCRIEAGILAFAVGKVLELPNDPGSMKPGPRQVRVDRLDPDHHRMPARGRSARRAACRNHDRAAAELKLRAVGADPQPDLESERRREPFHGGWKAWIIEDGHYCGPRQGKGGPHQNRLLRGGC